MSLSKLQWGVSAFISLPSWPGFFHTQKKGRDVRNKRLVKIPLTQVFFVTQWSRLHLKTCVDASRFTQSRADSLAHNRGHSLETGALKRKFSSSMAQGTELSWGWPKAGKWTPAGSKGHGHPTATALSFAHNTSDLRKAARRGGWEHPSTKHHSIFGALPTP